MLYSSTSIKMDLESKFLMYMSKFASNQIYHKKT